MTELTEMSEHTDVTEHTRRLGSVIEVNVGPVAHGGWCVARHEGRVVFVRHTLPGERVRAKVTETTSRFWRADAVEILRASPDRTTPPCPYAGPGKCGGCDWQHVTPAAQRRLKASVVAEHLRRLAGLEWPVVVEELPGTPNNLDWRTRVRFAVTDDGTVGFHRHRSSQVEPIDHCPIAHPEVERAGVESLRWKGARTVEVVVSAATADRVVLVDGGRSAVPRLPVPVRVVRGKPMPGPGLPYVREHAAGRDWRVSGGAFWQVHPAAAQALVDAVGSALQARPGDTVLDLYCGVGLFAGALGEQVGPDGQVLGIESDPVSVHDARHNLRDLPQVQVEQGRVERVLDDPRLRASRTVDLVVADPPRAGLGKGVVDRLASLAGRRIAYVSCDPATLGRDLARFAEHGWTITGLRAFDAFPMTHHVECVATLTRQAPR